VGWGWERRRYVLILVVPEDVHEKIKPALLEE